MDEAALESDGDTAAGLEPLAPQASSAAAKGPGDEPTIAGPDMLSCWLPRQRTDFYAAWAVAALGFLAFVNSLWNGFVYDDVPIIVDNRAIRHLSDLRGIFAYGYWYWFDPRADLSYRPIVIFSYALNYAAAGLKPFTYHLVNVLLHAANSALVYRLLMVLFSARGLALAAAAAFALHPIHTEAVANVVGRAELLANAFLFLSWWWYLRWNEGPMRVRARWLAASVAAFALAIFTKEHAVVLLGLLVLADLFRASERGLPLSQVFLEKCRTAYVWYLPALALYSAARFLVLGTLLGLQVRERINPLAYTDLWTRLLTAIKVLGKYLWLLLVPFRLSPDYSYNQIPISHSLAELGVLVSLLVLLVLFVLAVWSWPRKPVISFGIAVFGLTVLPVSNVPFPIVTLMAERVLYLPSLGFCLVLALAVTVLVARPRGRLLAASAFVLLLLGYGTRTVLRNRDWRSDEALFAAAVQTSPNSAKVHLELGKTMLDSGDLSGSQREFERSLKIAPRYSLAYINLGKTLERQGQIDAASRAYQTATEVNPKSDGAHLDLGQFYLRRGMNSEALDEFRSAARLGVFNEKLLNSLVVGFLLLDSPIDASRSIEAATYYNSFMLRNNLGIVYMHLGRLQDAQRELEAAAALEPNSPEVQMNLGRVYAERGLPAQAEAHFKHSLRLQPGNPEVLNFLAAVLGEQGRLAEAQEALQTVLSLQPSNGEAHYILGILLARQGKLLDAQEQFEAALRITPQDPVARRALSEVLRQRGRTAEAKRELKRAEDQERLLRSAAPGQSRQRAR